MPLYFFDHEIFDARALITRRLDPLVVLPFKRHNFALGPTFPSILLLVRRRERLRRYVGLLAKRRGVIGIVCGRLRRLNSKPKVGRYLAATGRAVEDEGRGENTSIWLTQAWQEGLHEDHFRWVAGNFVSDHGA